MINSLDEAITHCLEVAEEKEKFENFVCGYCAPGYEDGYFKNTCRLPSNIPEGWSWGECSEQNCPLFSNSLECASEHRQLANLLKELKAYRKAEKEIEQALDNWNDIDNGKCRGLYLAASIIQNYKNEEVNAND